MEVAPLAQSDHPFSVRPNSLCLRQSRLDPIVRDEAANLVRQQQIPMLGLAAQFDRLFCVAHRFLESNQFSLIAPLTAHRGFNQSRFEFHPQAQPKLLELFLNLVQRLFPEVAILQHLSLRLHR